MAKYNFAGDPTQVLLYTLWCDSKEISNDLEYARHKFLEAPEEYRQGLKEALEGAEYIVNNLKDLLGKE